MMNIPTRLSRTLLGVLISVSAGIAAAGPISPLYLSGIAVRNDVPGFPGVPLDVNEIAVVQGTSVINSWVTHTAGGPGGIDPTLQSGDESALAVRNTVRTLGAQGQVQPLGDRILSCRHFHWSYIHKSHLDRSVD